MSYLISRLEAHAETAQEAVAHLDDIAARLVEHNPKYAKALAKRKDYWLDKFAVARLQIDCAEIFGSRK